MSAKKIFVPGTVLCVLEKDGNIIEGKLQETVVSILEETGNYEVVMFTDSGEIPWFIVQELQKDGLLWIKGQEKLAAKLREIRAKQQEERLWQSLTLDTKLHLLACATTVAKGLLQEKKELVKMIKRKASQDECLKFVNENF